MPDVVEFFFELSSPYSYIAATQLGALATRTGARTLWKPFLLGAVFQATGNVAPATVPAKGIYLLRDLGRQTTRLGIPFSFPATFPINAIKAQRLLLATAAAQGQEVHNALALALFRAYWAEKKDIREDAVLLDILKSQGLPDPAGLLEATGTQRVKDALKATTDEATARGVFGAPTFFVGDEMFWGADRMAELEHFLEEPGRT